MSQQKLKVETARGPVDPIEEMVGALTDPLIVYPAGGWEDTLPEELKERLPLDRLIHNMKCDQGKAQLDEACDLEALLYLYPLCLAVPLSEQWGRIYLYLGTLVMVERTPEDIRHESLGDDDMGELRKLKQWIYRKKREVRKARRKGEWQTENKIVEAKVEQVRLF